jgi:adenosylmethionine---8-amino-7-oxononanoate aminotransferase
MPETEGDQKTDQVSRSAYLKKWDKRVLWHPFTQMQDWVKEDPLVIDRAEGVWLYDTDGKRYLDGVSSLWVTVHGHRVPEIDQAIKDQVDQMAHSTLLGLTHAPAIELAQRLVHLSPKGLSRVFYSDSGSEAVEIALKMAYQFWQQRNPRAPRKRQFLAIQNSYHGDTIGAVSVGGIDLFHKIYKPLLFDAVFAPSPYCYRCPEKHTQDSCCMEPLKEIERTLIRHKSEWVAVVIEPVVQGAAGMLTQPPGYLKGVEALCREHNILLIADCVAVGFGRTGKMFACEHEGIQPDLMAVAKGLTGGYLPLAATLATEEVYEAFLGEQKDLKTFFHGHTYTGNPIACRAAIANLELFKKNKTLMHLQPKIRLLKNELARLNELEHVGEIRQRGFMVGIELVKDKKTKAPYLWEDGIGSKVIKEARKRGVIIRPLGNVIVLMPPLSIEEDEIRLLCEVVYQSIEKAT